MTDNESAVDALSILQSDLAGEDLTYPVLKPGVVDFVISDMKLEPAKKGTGTMLNFTLATTIPWPERSEAVKASGFKFRDSIFIPANGTPEAIKMAKQKLAALKLSAQGTQEGAFGSPESYIGKHVTARIRIDSDVEFGDRNRVVMFVKRTAQ